MIRVDDRAPETLWLGMQQAVSEWRRVSQHAVVVAVPVISRQAAELLEPTLRKTIPKG